ncbi:alpha/beta fold hydrolase [Pseudonocardia hispaniensis]|uniref:Alpha/beta fold hydrolase n=1 Tax=Pseudonocardia hispaniensis TaxID=904933 RepID=A0ABW1J092_9PSEU
MSRLPMLQLNGARYEYEDIPAASGGDTLAPLLFLHEGLGSVGLWRGFHRRIAAATGRRAVAYSRLGHGYSDLPPTKRTPSFMHEEAVGVVPALAAALGLVEPVLVGHSDGASIALLVAAAQPVRGLVTLAPHVFVEPHGLDGIVATRTAYLEGDLRTRMTRHHRDPDVTFWNWNDVWLDPQFRNWDITAELAGIRCPVLGVQGEADQYGSMVHVEAVHERALGPVTLLALSCGHSPHLERPEETDRAVTDFLRSLG